MKILYLTNNNISLKLAYWLINKENQELLILQDKVEYATLKEIKPDFIISYNYRFVIKKDIIDKYTHKIINLHTSYLPWNRGAYPNFWSFIYNTPKGVSIHFIDEGIDTGEILFQKELLFDESKESFESSYYKLHEEIQNLFKNNWTNFKDGDCKIIKQHKESGSFNSLKDMENISDIIGNINWKINIKSFKEKYSNILKKFNCFV